MKIKKKLIKIGSMIVLVITLATGIFIYRVQSENKNAISVVQNGVSKINKDTNYKKAFEKYFNKLNWYTYKTNDGVRIAGFIAKRYVDDRNTMADYDISYIVKDNNTFEFYKGSVNGVEINQIEMLTITIKAMSSYESVNNY